MRPESGAGRGGRGPAGRTVSRPRLTTRCRIVSHPRVETTRGVGACVGGAQVQWVQIGCAHLARVNLNGASLARANFDGVDLDGAWLQGADLHEANFGPTVRCRPGRRAAGQPHAAGPAPTPLPDRSNPAPTNPASGPWPCMALVGARLGHTPNTPRI